MRLSDQALICVAMAVQKGLMEQIDITDILRNYVFELHGDEMYIINPPRTMRMKWREEDNEEESEEECQD